MVLLFPKKSSVATERRTPRRRRAIRSIRSIRSIRVRESEEAYHSARLLYSWRCLARATAQRVGFAAAPNDGRTNRAPIGDRAGERIGAREMPNAGHRWRPDIDRVSGDGEQVAGPAPCAADRKREVVALALGDRMLALRVRAEGPAECPRIDVECRA